MTTAAVEKVAIPTEVWEFAAKQGVTEFVRPVVETALEVFDGLPVTVTLEADPEIEDDWRIVMIVTIHRTASDDMLAARYRYYDAVNRVCPPNRYVGTFCLSTRST